MLKNTLMAAMICLALAAVGCAERRRPAAEPFPVEGNGGCKYVYERRVDEKPVRPDEVRQSDYVVMLFSATGNGRILAPGPAHNFAIFAKVKGDKAEESVTISWFPKSMNVNTRGTEQGFNADLPTTLSWARTQQARVERFGPYYIREDLYARAKNQAERLNTGYVQYKVNDNGQRPDSASNSVHAISDILCNGDRFDVFLIQTGKGRDASAVLKTYFEKEGFLDGKYRNDRELLQQFDLQHIRRID